MSVFRKVVLALMIAASICAIASWTFLTLTICSSPSTVSAATQHTVAYSCHGSVVFITPFQSTLLTWLVPVLFLLLVLTRAVGKKGD